MLCLRDITQLPAAIEYNEPDILNEICWAKTLVESFTVQVELGFSNVSH